MEVNCPVSYLLLTQLCSKFAIVEHAGGDDTLVFSHLCVTHSEILYAPELMSDTDST